MSRRSTAEGSLLAYFANLPQSALDRLYGDGWTCQGLLRALPSLARLYALRLVMVSAEEGGGLPLDLVSSWPQPTKEAGENHTRALGALRKLRVLQEGEIGGAKAVWLHRSFATQLRDCLCVGGVLGAADEAQMVGDEGATAAGAAAAASSSSAISLAELEQQANGAWERVLNAILQPTKDAKLAMKCEGASMHELLKEADLIEPVEEDDDEDADGDAVMGSAGGVRLRVHRLSMTRSAAKYLLQPTQAQVWKLVRAYMELAERGTPGTRHATLCFLMRLGLLQLGKGYRMDDPSLGDEQRATLADMALLGLVHRPPSAPHMYYATHLSQHLLSGSAAGSAVSTSSPSASGKLAAGGSAGGSGFIVLETNFRLYAYTGSALWAQVLQIFMEVRYVLPNMIVGDLTRDSVLAASRRGVSSEDIRMFMERNAHPRMASSVPIMPENVLTVMEIWSREPHRLTIKRAQLYENFQSLEDFRAALAYAKDTKCYAWHHEAASLGSCKLAVQQAGHAELKKFIRARRQAASASAPGS